MAKTEVSPGLWGELFRFELYKKNQGRITRQVTALSLLAIIAFGAWTLSATVLADYSQAIRTLIPAALVGVAAWVVFRIIHYPRFADFLISVQAEMDKVSWPSRSELYRATVVVLGTMFLLGFVLFAFDLFWVWLFTQLRILTA